jgi:hypothetical protein
LSTNANAEQIAFAIIPAMNGDKSSFHDWQTHIYKNLTLEEGQAPLPPIDKAIILGL